LPAAAQDYRGGAEYAPRAAEWALEWPKRAQDMLCVPLARRGGEADWRGAKTASCWSAESLSRRRADSAD